MLSTREPLYRVADRYASILDRIEDNDGELTPELEAEFLASEGSLEEKFEAVAQRRRDAQAERDKAKKEGTRFLARSKTFDSTDRSLERLQAEGLRRAGLERIDTGRTLLFFQRNPPSAQWVGDPDKIPNYLARIIPETREFDARTALKIAKTGEPLPHEVHISQGVRLVQK